MCPLFQCCCTKMSSIFLMHLIMEQRTFKNVNNYLNTNIYSYWKTSGGQSSNLYLKVVHFSTPELIRHLWQLKTVVFLHWCLICTVLLGISPTQILVLDLLKTNSFLVCLSEEMLLSAKLILYIKSYGSLLSYSCDITVFEQNFSSPPLLGLFINRQMPNLIKTTLGSGGVILNAF